MDGLEQMETKNCHKCLMQKPTTEFYVNRGKKASKDGLTTWCKSCQSAAASKWNKSNPEKHSIAYKKWHSKRGPEMREKQKFWVWRSMIKRNYGLTPTDYEAMFKAQSGACAICQHQNLNGDKLAIDHDHKTMKVRALLCKPCNVAIGNFRESEEIMAAAITYLQKHNLDAVKSKGVIP